ncbi:LPXTG cell wall anchor domain-containing protein [Salinispora tropica]|uniref:LPXTG-motif cell wall anchor domain n=1 Tax=Salinispora tropica (strain ATCC BAA-916 / DSM 44818 / JCM 13857 / NBRC 105044 / CNB-440) TaxID=369723 RepID=A4X1J5_SALTO|nr:LPXTG cell wall anchor domain-containing protein [Salinispora tropica]ABP52745.1 LPXTG-motif cell wall anchor domain [Salinispora tropica CNB-440]
MRWKILAGALMALAFVIPATPAAAQVASPGLDESCQTVERKVYKDIRELVTIDPDTAEYVKVRRLANQILSAANKHSFVATPPELQTAMSGSQDDLRAFLKTRIEERWLTDLRIKIGKAMAADPDHTNVYEAAQEVLNTSSMDAHLAFLNDGLYAARELDCAAQPTPTPSATATATPTPSTTVTASPTTPATDTPTPTPSTSLGTASGEGGGLPLTGANTATVAGIGGALLLLGGAGYLIGRRRRTRFLT